MQPLTHLNPFMHMQFLSEEWGTLNTPSPVAMDMWQNSRFDTLGAIAISLHAGGRARVVAHELQIGDLVRQHPLCVSNPV